jgi:hypothetical protein
MNHIFAWLSLLATTRQFLSCAFPLTERTPFFAVNNHGSTALKSQPVATTQEVLENASRILSNWDRSYSSNIEIAESECLELTGTNRSTILNAVLVLNQKATEERLMGSTRGRCMLGICASSTSEGVATLKSWVTNLDLPRGLLLGMDIDGAPITFNGGVYIKYNSGGVYTFSDIRKSGIGFNAIWKPGDAMIEEYDGKYRGVYFQVELADGEFRQYLLPQNLFD